VAGIPETLLHTVSFVIAITIVVVLHVLLGEMVPKNIAIAGPESTAMLLIPAYLIWMRVARPFIAFYNWCANITLRAMGVQVKDELDITVSTVWFGFARVIWPKPEETTALPAPERSPDPAPRSADEQSGATAGRERPARRPRSPGAAQGGGQS
jgi:hypothetical protein